MGHSLIVPKKIEWILPVVHASPIDHIQSSSLRKVLKCADDQLAKNNLEFRHESLTEEFFEKTWLPLYVAESQAAGRDILIASGWWQKKQEQRHQLWHQGFWQSEKYLGGNLIVERPDALILGFKTLPHFTFSQVKNLSLGAIAEYFFLRWAWPRRHECRISSGHARNSFGATTAYGYLEFKLRFGYLPQVDPDPEWQSEWTWPPKRPVFFWGREQSKPAFDWFVWKPDSASTLREAIQTGLLKRVPNPQEIWASQAPPLLAGTLT